MSKLGTPEILILALLVVVFFGSKKLPEFIKSIGLAVKEFKKSVSE
ncbi:MAG: Sec-independent protein translocase protein TatA [Candidatus Woesebacteria bacterium GW2011_GWC2_33_12]|uniref:Sec-independent protein translocase protein TatA n=1 Tax=Candidatus Woesebacteria bacterium GW2011_GWB1_33_22 TaxID=1618566 RepID=A0A0G0A0A2_9BACT|nr:MAG: Sec-independent protein translocase protein TatA [Candidatus Woesebacteria bacterium GW2011_GWC2_33_12]KKP41957.1 MAG: Sec-independent protein translocase protein TatA [Candidatus Woesebacteria bacterium GW2011_GWA2_33_20]KKP44606.1 MAG: Sec-independent protein translocase protein TatA [Candidatus Woesebacteria bacterium GW2011_GWB1_33_22]KKP46410.1 MAG: Sec-independent protein translocase protein TatA [Microgenomates group bacterium GW2011_GWC1_33_28]KKP50464.1 MAG: Sec-independent pro